MKMFWQVDRLDRNCKNSNLCESAQEASEEVLRALKAGFEVQVTKVYYTQAEYDSFDDFQDNGWEPL